MCLPLSAFYAMKQEINIIKVGGAVVEDAESLATVLDQFADVHGHKVLVHGGGREATRIAASLGIESRMVNGRRITDQDMLRIVTMVYGGLVNKTVVAKLQALGINAIGLTGADMDIIRSHRRPLKEVSMDDGHTEMVDFGFVGDVDTADGKALSDIVESNIVPVVAPLTHDGRGTILNTNADTIASAVARALAPFYRVTLTYCFEMPGVMRDPEDKDSVIRKITRESYAMLKADNVVSGGMIPKLDNAFEAISQGVSRVVITHFNDIAARNGTTIL